MHPVTVRHAGQEPPPLLAALLGQPPVGIQNVQQPAGDSGQSGSVEAARLLDQERLRVRLLLDRQLGSTQPGHRGDDHFDLPSGEGALGAGCCCDGQQWGQPLAGQAGPRPERVGVPHPGATLSRRQGEQPGQQLLRTAQHVSTWQVAGLQLGDQHMVERFQLATGPLGQPQHLEHIVIGEAGERAPGQLGDSCRHGRSSQHHRVRAGHHRHTSDTKARV
ncbi:MAG TPA: hypothetical protein VF612_12240 [Jatrophihabitans sp.]